MKGKLKSLLRITQPVNSRAKVQTLGCCPAPNHYPVIHELGREVQTHHFCSLHTRLQIVPDSRRIPEATD